MVVRYIIQGKHVHPDSGLQGFAVPGFGPEQDGIPLVHDTAEGGVTLRCVLPADETVPVRVVYPDETVVIGPGHDDVDIIIPGNKSFVPYGSEKGTEGHGIPDVIIPAEPVDVFENLQGTCVHLFQ